MKTEELTVKQINSVRCTTCGAASGEACDLHSGSSFSLTTSAFSRSSCVPTSLDRADFFQCGLCSFQGVVHIVS